MEHYAIEINHGQNGNFRAERQHFWEFFFCSSKTKTSEEYIKSIIWPLLGNIW